MAPDPDDDEAFAEQLFEAARRERPAESVKQRALQPAPAAPQRAARMGWLLLAAALGAVFVLLGPLRRSDPQSVISAEPMATLSSPQASSRLAESQPLAADAASQRHEALPGPIPSSPEAAGQRAESQAPSDSKANASKPSLEGAPSKALPATLEQELGLLDEARRSLLAGNTDTALARLSHYDKVATSRRLGAEATLLRIQILAAAGRSLEASGLARAFVAKNPNSPLVDRAQGFILDRPLEEGNRGNAP